MRFLLQFGRVRVVDVHLFAGLGQALDDWFDVFNDSGYAIEIEDDEPAETSTRLDAHLSFGFAPDPVFPELDWEDDDEEEPEEL